eukprot:1004602-Prymnesium_polylepis.1
MLAEGWLNVPKIAGFRSAWMQKLNPSLSDAPFVRRERGRPLCAARRPRARPGNLVQKTRE